MLNGGGTVPPSSKYEIHNLLLANFHSMSAFSCEIVIKILDSNFYQNFGLLLTKKSISWELKNHAEGRFQKFKHVLPTSQINYNHKFTSQGKILVSLEKLNIFQVCCCFEIKRALALIS